MLCRKHPGVSTHGGPRVTGKDRWWFYSNVRSRIALFSRAVAA